MTSPTPLPQPRKNGMHQHLLLQAAEIIYKHPYHLEIDELYMSQETYQQLMDELLHDGVFQNFAGSGLWAFGHKVNYQFEGEQPPLGVLAVIYKFKPWAEMPTVRGTVV